MFPRYFPAIIGFRPIFMFLALSISTAMPLGSSGDSFEVNLTVSEPNSTLMAVVGNLTSVRNPNQGDDSEFQRSIHLSTSLAGMILMLFLHYHVRTFGYRLSRSFWLSTDNLLWVGMGVISTLWTILIVVSAALWENDNLTPCKNDSGGAKCAGRLAFAPWILNSAFLWWLARYGMHRIWRVIICTCLCETSLSTFHRAEHVFQTRDNRRLPRKEISFS
jgi:hypothetical protein